MKKPTLRVLGIALLLAAPSLAVAPRLDDVMISRAAFDGQRLDVTLLVAGANFDEGLTVELEGPGVPASLRGELATRRRSELDNRQTMYAKDPSTLGYPIEYYHAHELTAAGLTAGSTLGVTVKNPDGSRSELLEYRLPATPEELDSDGDGLPDHWEEHGYDADGDGTIDVPLDVMGAHPHRKDLFVEVDWISYLTAGKPRSEIWPTVEKAFLGAPVFNPDGSHGIVPHIDRGQADFGGPGVAGQGGEITELVPENRHYWYPLGGDGPRTREEAARACEEGGATLAPAAVTSELWRQHPMPALVDTAVWTREGPLAYGTLATPSSGDGRPGGESPTTVACVGTSPPSPPDRDPPSAYPLGGALSLTAPDPAVLEQLSETNPRYEILRDLLFGFPAGDAIGFFDPVFWYAVPLDAPFTQSKAAEACGKRGAVLASRETTEALFPHYRMWELFDGAAWTDAGALFAEVGGDRLSLRPPAPDGEPPPTHAACIGPGPGPARDAPPQLYPAELTQLAFSVLKRQNHDAHRREIFRYSIFGYVQPEPHQASSGVSEGARLGERGLGQPHNDFLVTVGHFGERKDAENVQVGTFLHELGHTLGLSHGGGDVVSYKPNYNSVMSYTYQHVGIDRDGKLGGDGIFTYSQGMRRALDENQLDEERGLVDGVAINWNQSPCAGDASKCIDKKPVRADLNPEFTKEVRLGCTADFESKHGSEPTEADLEECLKRWEYTRLTDYPDWARIELDFRREGSSWNGD